MMENMKFEYETPEMLVAEFVNGEVLVRLSGGEDGTFGDQDW